MSKEILGYFEHLRAPYWKSINTDKIMEPKDMKKIEILSIVKVLDSMSDHYDCHGVVMLSEHESNWCLVRFNDGKTYRHFKERLKLVK